MPEERFEEKTEPATQRKREETRKQGQVARSVDLNSAVILLAAILAMNLFGRQFISGLMALLVEQLGGLARFDMNPHDANSIMGRAGMFMVGSMLPFVIIVTIAALGVSFLQVGFVISAEPLTPNLGRMNPITGIKRIISLRGLMRLVSGLLKVTVVGTVLFMTIWGERDRLMMLMNMFFDDAVNYIVEVIFLLAIRAALALLVLAILDYAYQRWQHEQDIKMSKQEIKEEMKRYEGDPKIRERRRAIQRQLAMQRMMARVPKATVVVTNPTEISIALEYTQEQMDAPTVTAKGAGHLAMRIREIAMENDVPVVQRPEVARTLFRVTEVGQTIPNELYQAVAEILALVYRMKGAAA